MFGSGLGLIYKLDGRARLRPTFLALGFFGSGNLHT
jgi:hypothetical protein